eukprot:749570-Amphidinium_carterae.1
MGAGGEGKENRNDVWHRTVFYTPGALLTKERGKSRRSRNVFMKEVFSERKTNGNSSTNFKAVSNSANTPQKSQ